MHDSPERAVLDDCVYVYTYAQAKEEIKIVTMYRNG